MKLIFKSNDNPENIMRRAGYGLIGKDPNTNELSFSRRMGGNDYPRFHAYTKKDGENVTISLHIDQKKASYEGHTAHSGEYDGDLVEKEIEYIKRVIGIK